MNFAKFVPYDMKTCLVKVSSYDEKNIKGVLINPYYEQELYFSSLTQLLIMMDELYDTLNFPQRAMENRSFKDNVSGQPETEAFSAISPPENVPVLASFKISVLFRQNASWQGNIMWLEEKYEAQFRSVLELILIIDSAFSK